MFDAELDPIKLETLIQDVPIVLVDFWTQWCAPCKQFTEIFKRIAHQYPDLAFVSINAETYPELAESLQVKSVPHLLIFKQQIMVYATSGSMTEAHLEDLIKQTLALEI